MNKLTFAAFLLVGTYVIESRSLGSEMHSINLNWGEGTPQVWTLNAFGIGNMHLARQGVFDIPQIDTSKFALTAIHFALTTELGGAVWTNAIGNGLTGNIGFGESVFLQIGGTFYSAQQTDPFTDPVHSFASIVSFDETLLDQQTSNLDFYADGNLNFPGGFTPMRLSLAANANGSLNADPMQLVWISNPVLKVTYEFEPLIENWTDADLPMGDGQQRLSLYVAQSSPGTVIPDSIDLPLEVMQKLLVGNANADCEVGTADYAIWAAQFDQTGVALAADFDNSGSVGTADYALWAANFGNTCPSPAPASVPEPPGEWLMGWACAAGAIGVRFGRARQRATGF